VSDVICPTCGATGTQNCSTMRGNDHRKRMLLEIQQPFSSAACPQPCDHLSAEDAREGRGCEEHPCTCEVAS